MWKGHSGGPCVNARGHVVGWNVRSATEGNMRAAPGDRMNELRPIAEGASCIKAAQERLAELATEVELGIGALSID